MNPEPQAVESIPNFMIIGAAKSGTTTLFDLLKQHPQVYLPYRKEPMFFSHDDNFINGFSWYLRTYFKKADIFKARGEATPHYLYWSVKTAPRIKDAFGDRNIKFLIILRDPVQRAYSWYLNMLQEGMEDLSFMNALQSEQDRIKDNWAELYRTGSMAFGYFRGGAYASLLRPFLDLFPINAFHFLKVDDLVSQFDLTIRTLFNFLDLDPNVTIKLIKSNPASMPQSRRLHTLFHQRSKLKEIAKPFIPEDIRYRIKEWAIQSNLKPLSTSKLDIQVENELRLRFKPEVMELESIIRQDLSAWLPK